MNIEGIENRDVADPVKIELKEEGIDPEDLDLEDINLYLKHKNGQLESSELQNRNALLRLGTPTSSQIKLIDFLFRQNLK